MVCPRRIFLAFLLRTPKWLLDLPQRPPLMDRRAERSVGVDGHL